MSSLTPYAKHQMTADGGVPIVFTEELKCSVPEEVYKAMGKVASCQLETSFIEDKPPMLKRDKSIRLGI